MIKRERKESVCKSMPCIAKSADFRPSIVYVDSMDGGMMAIKPTDEAYDVPLCVPVSMLYKHDLKLLEQLKRAYARKNMMKLDALWKKAQPLKREVSMTR